MEEGKNRGNLDEQGKRDPFEAPAGYFDGLNSRVQARINRPGAKVVSMPSWQRLGFAVAATLTLIALVWYVGLQPAKNASPEELLADVPTEDLVAFLESEDMDVQEILEGVSGEDSFFDSELDPLNELYFDEDPGALQEDSL